MGVLLPQFETGILLLTASWIAGVHPGHAVQGSFVEFKIAASLFSITLLSLSTPPLDHCE